MGLAWSRSRLPFLLPVVSAERLQALSNSYLYPIIISMTMVALVHGLHRIKTTPERRWWTMISAGSGCWFLLAWLTVLFQTTDWRRGDHPRHVFLGGFSVALWLPLHPVGAGCEPSFESRTTFACVGAMLSICSVL